MVVRIKELKINFILFHFCLYLGTEFIVNYHTAVKLRLYIYICCTRNPNWICWLEIMHFYIPELEIGHFYVPDKSEFTEMIEDRYEMSSSGKGYLLSSRVLVSILAHHQDPPRFVRTNTYL